MEVLIINKYEIKKIYKLSQNVKNERQLKKKLNEYNGIYLIRSASSENIEILKRYIYDKPFGMQRKYDRLYKEDVQRL